MRFPVGCRLLLPAALLLVVLTALAPAAAAKGKKVTCKGAKVPVTIGKKTTCQPMAKVLPKPRAIDLRLAHLEEAMKFDPAKAVRGKKRKRARTLQSGFGAAGKRAQKKILRLLPAALKLIDRKAGGARSSGRLFGPALASAGCQPEEPSPVGHTGGASIGSFGDNGGYIDAPVGGGIRVRVTFVSCGGVNNYRVPECPTANGSVDAKGTGEFRATIEVFDGGQFVSRNSSVFEDKAKVHGEVGADAKLKFIEVEHTEEVFIVASGGIVIRGGVTRKVRIDMPGGRFNPAGASVRFFGDPIAPDSGAKAFASTAEAAIRSYRTAEARWSTFNPSGGYCAEPVFAPDSNTLKLRKGNSKQLSIYAKARADGGRATEARWTLLNQENAAFLPTSSQDAAPTISYTVTNAPEGGFVKVKVKFTSTAGVGEKTWTQPTEKGLTINKIAGTFSQKSVLHVMQGDSVAEISGNVTFERFTPAIFGGASGLYKFKEGFVSVTFSGNGAMTDSAPLCSQKGSLQLAFSEPGSSFFALGTGPEQLEPYEYSFSLASDNDPEPAKVKIDIYNCDEVAKEQEDDDPEYPVFLGMSQGGNSADGLTYSGSDSNLVSGSGVIENWSFQGTE